MPDIKQERNTQSFNDFHPYHDQPLTHELAQELKQKQDRFLHQTLAVIENMEIIRTHTKYVTDKFGQKVNTSHQLATLLDEFVDYTADILGPDTFSKPDSFKEKQTAFFKKVSNADINDHEKLALEFLLGTVRFMIGTKHNLEFAKFAQAKQYEQNPDKKEHNYQFDAPLQAARVDQKGHMHFESNALESKLHGLFAQFSEEQTSTHRRSQFFNVLTHVAQIADDACCLNLNNSTQEEGDFWPYMHEFYAKDADHGTYSTLKDHIVSMHHIDEKNLDTVTLAQVLHWQGTGGKGFIFEGYDSLKNALGKQGIGWHKEAKTANTTITEPRAKPLYASIQAFRQETQAFAFHAIKESMNNDNPIAFFVLGSGPTMGHEAPIIQSISELGYTSLITVTDVDASSVSNLIESKENQTADSVTIGDKTLTNATIANVRYFDMNRCGKYENTEKDLYDVVSFAISAHQIAQAKDGHPNVYTRLLKDLTQKTKPGGFIFNPDVAAGVVYELPFILGNITDREGNTTKASELNLSTLAVETDDSHVKIPFPLLKLVSEQPTKLVELHGKGIYHFNGFEVIKISKDILPQLAEEFTQGNYEACCELVRQETNIDVLALQETILANIAAEHQQSAAGVSR